MRRRIAIIFLALAFALFSACQSSHPPVHGIPNFGKVNERQKIYRGGEPLTSDGWAFLQSLGVRTVVKLNTEMESHDFGATALHMKVIRRPITDQQQLTGSPDFHNTIDSAVGVMRRGAVFVHCGSDGRSKPNSFGALTDTQGGQDRTGLVVGCYRVRVEHWKKAEARSEMKSFHFHAMLLPGLARFWRDQVR
jgi:protein tyrosine/serine phosphatase